MTFSTGCAILYPERTKERNLKMYEYEILNKETEEIEFMWGYSIEDAFRRRGFNRDEWKVISSEYID